MPDITANEIITLRHKRNFIQFGGAGPTNLTRYAGQNAQYMAIDGVSIAETGGIDPVWVPDPRRIGAFRLVAKSLTAPDLPTATLLMKEKHGPIPRQLFKIGCAFNMYEATGTCGDLSDFLTGWSDYVLIYSGAQVTDKDLGTRSSWDADDPVEDSLSLILSQVYPVGSMAFGEGASTMVDKEIADAVYGSVESCGDCSPTDAGDQRIYAITKSSGAGSPGLQSEVIYSVDGGNTWNQMNINGIGATEDAIGIDVVGTNLVVIGSGAYYYAAINQQTGVPGTFTKVTNGFVATKDPTDIFVAGPREVYFSGKGGYIYTSTDITSGVTVSNAGAATNQDLNRVHGLDDTIVCVGNQGQVIKTVNRGITWAATTTLPCGLPEGLTAVAVKANSVIWVGSGLGRIYYTLNGGTTWTERPFSGSGAGQVKDLIFPTAEVGFFSHSTATPSARVFATWNGGADWTNAAPRVLNMLTFTYANRLAAPVSSDPAVAANNLVVGGLLSAVGGDGILIVGAAGKL